MSGVEGAPVVDLLCLDDTGSSVVDIYSQDDGVMLGLMPAYNGWMGNIALDTANGAILLESVLMDINIKDHLGHYLGPWSVGLCAYRPGSSLGKTRCSGMAVRKRYFACSVPEPSGRLFISDKKSGITAHIPSDRNFI